MSPIGNDAPFVDASGNPLSGGKLYFYTAGSSTPQDTYTTYLGTVANANPVILDSGGYPATGGSVVEIWFTSGVSYKAVLATSADVIVWTRDRLVGINDTTVTIDEWVSGAAPTYISATSFSLVGDQTSTYQVGRRIKTTNTAGTIYSTITVSAFGAVTTVTVVNDSGVLDSGLSAVSYALLSSLNPSDPRSVGVTVAAHATTSNVWASEQVTLTGGAVTFTDIADAPYVGAVAWVKQNAAHIWTDGAVFVVQGDANYTAAAGDWIRIYATTVSTFEVTVFRADGGTVGATGVAWTPTLTFATAGNLSVVYSTRLGSSIRNGKLMEVSFTIITSTFTHTTASGNLQITGLPATSKTETGYNPIGAIQIQGVTKANYTWLNCEVGSATATMQAVAGGSAQALSFIAAADMPTGGSVIIRGTLSYETA